MSDQSARHSKTDSGDPGLGSLVLNKKRRSRSKIRKVSPHSKMEKSVGAKIGSCYTASARNGLSEKSPSSQERTLSQRRPRRTAAPTSCHRAASLNGAESSAANPVETPCVRWEMDRLAAMWLMHV
jgi:hypothetical protein